MVMWSIQWWSEKAIRTGERDGWKPSLLWVDEMKRDRAGGALRTEVCAPFGTGGCWSGLGWVGDGEKWRLGRIGAPAGWLGESGSGLRAVQGREWLGGHAWDRRGTFWGLSGLRGVGGGFVADLTPWGGAGT
jgi:hypothetical protein